MCRVKTNERKYMKAVKSDFSYLGSQASKQFLKEEA